MQVHRLPSGRQQKLDYLQWEVPEGYCQELKINQQLHEQAAKIETKAEKIARESPEFQPATVQSLLAKSIGSEPFAQGTDG